MEDRKTDTRDDGKRGDAAPVVQRPVADKPVGDKDVGKALRSVYSSMVGEDIPADLLDLLSKLN